MMWSEERRKRKEKERLRIAEIYDKEKEMPPPGITHNMYPSYL